MVLHTLIIISIAIFELCTAEKLPVFMTTCKRDSDNYSACLKDAVYEAWPKFVKGLPEYDMQSLDPFYYEYQEVTVDADIIRATISVENVTVFGIKDSTFTDVRAHLDNRRFRLELDITMPHILIRGNCKTEGSMSGFRLSGKGFFNITMNDVISTWKFIGHVKDDTLILSHFRSYPQVGDLKVYADNLFDGSKELSDLAIQFANDYWPALYRLMMPLAAEGWDVILVKRVNSFFAHFSFKELFP